MRVIFLCLAALLALIQYPLWLGKGGWLHVSDMDRQVEQAHRKNDELRARNAKLDSEVQDLKQGKDAVEERARYELGMIKQDEIFVQVLDPNAASPAPVTPEGAPGLGSQNRAATLDIAAKNAAAHAAAVATAANAPAAPTASPGATTSAAAKPAVPAKAGKPASTAKP